MKNYLDDRLRTAINDYRKATEPDFYTVKAKILHVEDNLAEIKRMQSQIKKLSDQFNMQQGQIITDEKQCRVRGVVHAVQKAGELLRLFDDAVARISDDQQEANYTVAYPNHLRDIAPIFEINPRKELEIIANKYKKQAETALMQASRSSENLHLQGFDGMSTSSQDGNRQS